MDIYIILLTCEGIYPILLHPSIFQVPRNEVLPRKWAMMMMMACLNVVFNYLVGNDSDEYEDGDTTMAASVDVAERTVP